MGADLPVPRLPRLYVPSALRGRKTVKLQGDYARYLSSVLRAGAGFRLTVFDSEGDNFMAEVVSRQGRAVELRIIQALPPQPEPQRGVILCQGILKGQKMDLVIQKATELGVREIAPLITERSQVRDTNRLGRWRKIALEASRQSGRSVQPLIREPTGFYGFLESDPRPLEGVLFWEQGEKGINSGMFSSGAGDVLAVIGPEGGFTSEEAARAESKGLAIGSLGWLTLRSETASMAAISLIQYFLGNLGAAG